MEVCLEHISGSELCQPLEPVVVRINEDCVDCKNKKAKEQKREAGGEA